MNNGARFPQLVKWMFLTGIAFLIFMTAMRFIFFFYFAPLEYSFVDYLHPFLLGLNFDTRIVCGFIVFPFLIGNLHLEYSSNKKLSTGSLIQVIIAIVLMAVLVFFMKKGHATAATLTGIIIVFLLILVWLFATKNCNPFQNSFSKKVFKIYFFIITVTLVFLYAVDFQNYDYLHERLNASVMNYLSDAKISMNMVWQTYPVVTIFILIIVVTAIIFWLINHWFNKTAKTGYRGNSLSRIIIGIIFALILGLGVFGKIGQYPLRWSDAFVFDNNFKANLSLNPVQSFLSTLKFKNSTYDLQQVKKYYPLMVEYLGIKKPDSVHLNYKRIHIGDSRANKPNVVIVICESFSAYKSSMWGNPLNTTPYFNQMCEGGIFFDRCFTPAYGTARGVWATITSIPDVEFPNTSSRNPAYVNQHTIVNDYKGYKKYYFIGGSLSWANIRGLLTNNIDGLKLYEQEDYPVKSVDVWGISDKNLFLQANEVFRQQKKPFFAVIQTADNHRPYTIPAEDRNSFKLENYPTDTLKKYGFESNAELNAFRYTDFSFKTFIEAAKKEPYFNNTIFVFVGDHGIRGDAGKMLPQAWEKDGLTTQHVPLLFYAPALLKPERSGRTCSQVDILPSVSALANISYTNTAIGRNLFDSSVNENTHFKNLAFLFDPLIKQIGIITDRYVYVNDLSTGKEDFRSSADDNPLPGDVQTTEDRNELERLAEAYYQTSKYMLLNNKKQ
jgi:phosphoglycerol transferase MdoB-like AlkP superfamily enzyme